MRICSVRWRRYVGTLIGLLAAAVAIGVGELVAAFVRPEASPIIVVGNRIITLTPEPVKRTAIDNFGTNDKTALLLTIYVLLAAFGAFVGSLAQRRLAYGLLGVAAFGAFGCYCALTASAARTTDVLPTLAGTAAAATVMIVLAGSAARRRPAHARGTDRTDRRRFLQGSVATAGLAAIGGFGGRAVQHSRFDVAAVRQQVALPKPVTPAPVAVRRSDFGKSSYPWATANDAFYRIDTALSVPQINPKQWSLRIHGMLDREITLSYDQLRQRPLIERWITLCCVSNEVGGNLVGNARWLGARLADLLREAGVHADADQLVLSSADGMTIGAPTKAVLDGRDALIAIGMNGDPLPVEHGFPARIVVPGLYGYVSACKWVVDIEATTFAQRKAYWVQGGWAQQTDIKLESRIDTPQSGGTVQAGKPVAIAGVAWDQHVGVSKVEVQVDNDAWLPARLSSVPSTDTWRQWRVTWTPPKPGSYTVRVRATDDHGTVQTDKEQPVFPSGATGLHKITVRAK